MAHKALNRRKFSLLTSTALTGQAAALGALSVVFGASSAFALDPNALPQDPNVVGGAASFSQSGATLNVNQATNRTVIDWRSFDIGSNATTNFIQPGTSSIAVNRVNSSANPTEIQGSLNANGQVWILNPNGVLFGKTAKIDVAGIVASTGNINTDAFMRGDNRLQFTGSDGGEVSNAGLISVADGGLAAFVAPSVRNSGIIRARVGKVTLAAGTTFTLDLAGDQLVELGLGANEAIVDQSGQVLADGSVVNITAKAATEVVDSVINVSGTVLASSAYEDGGTIVLTADNITTTADAVLKADAGTNGDGGTIYGYADKLGKYDGTFSAQGGSQSGDGGFIETSGKKVQIADGISVNTLANHGATGEWTIDPVHLVVGSSGTGGLSGGTNDEESTISAATVVAGLNNTNVNLQATDSITVNEAITSSATGANKGNLALNDQDGGGLEINLNAKITLGAGKTLSGQGTTVNVGSTGSIQNGVDVASSGGATVNVADGTYNENVTISKSDLKLLSDNGRDATKIVGHGSSALGTVLIKSGANNVVLGDLDHGFEIIGVDNVSAGIESAAVYFQGANSGSTVRGNRITANGDAGLQGEYNAANVDLTIDNNIFDGQTFAGSTAGSGNQFSVPNVPRQLVVFGGGESTTNTKNISFTNNQVIGTAGGLTSGNVESGNSLVTIDAIGSTITGNTFADTTTAGSAALRARGSNTTISDNTFDGTNMGAGTSLVALKNGALSDTFADVIASNTWKNGAWVDRLNGGYNYVYRSVQKAVNDAIADDTVNVAAGTYDFATTLNIGKALSITGAGKDETIFNSTAVGNHGIYVIADNVSLSSFTLNAPPAGQFGIKVQPDGQDATSGRVNNFSIDNVTINGSQKNGLDLFGVVGANIENVTVKDSLGAGIAISNSSGVTITGTNTSGNGTAGLSLTQRGDYYTERVDDVTVDDTNTFNEDVSIYLADSAAAIDFGSLNIDGFDFVAGNVNAGTVYTYFQRNLQDAIDLAAGRSGYVQGWTGTSGDNIFTVGYNTANTIALSINAAVNAATTGATINVLSGIYNEAVAINKGLTLQGADSADRAQLKNGITFSGTFSDLTLKNLYVTNDTPAATRVIGGSTSITNLTLDNVAIDGQNIATQHGFSGGQYGGNISITNSQFLNIGNWSAFDTRSGAGGPGAGTSVISVVFSNNLIDNVKGGITFRQQDGGVFGDVTISDNIVQNIGSTANSTGGIFKIFNADTVDFSGNTISDIGTNGSVSSDGVQYGAALLARGVNTLNVTDNSFTNVHMAVAVEKANAAPGQTTFTNNTFDNNGYAFFMPGDALNGGNVTFGAGNEINSGADTVQDIVWRNSNALDLTNVKFDGKLGSEMTDAELFALEDLITHGTDLASSGLATVKAGNVYVTTNSGSIQRGADKSAAGDTVNIGNGTYVVNSANGYTHGRLEITKSVNLVGQSEAGTIIDGRGAATYGLRVVTGADNVSLSNFTVLGVGATNGYGIKVEDVQNFSIDHVTSHGAYKAQLDLNGVRGGTVDHVTADGTSNGVGTGSVKGAAIAITDSQNVTITNSSTNNGSYGGIAIYQSNKTSGYAYQTKDITIAATNTYGEANPVYMEDESATNNFGAVTVEGFDYIARNTNPADAYTWFQKTQQGAIDAAVLAAGYVEGWLGSAGNNVFTVGTSGGNAMSINAATNAAADNATINVLSGTYGAFGTSFGGASGVTIQTADGAIIDGTGLTGRIIDLRADGTTLTGFTINGDGTGVGVSVSGRDVIVSGNTIDGTLTGVQTTTQYLAGNATISGNTINTAHGISLQNTGNTVSGNIVTASAEGVGLLQSDNTFTGNTFNIGAGGNAMALYGTASANDLNASGNAVNIAGGALQGAVDLTGAGGNLNVNGGTYNEDVVVNGSRNISFVGATIDKFTTNVATAIGGIVSATNGFFLNAATTLLSNTVLNGSVAATSIDGSTAGGQTLTVNGGNNALGSLGVTTRLGATSISGTTTLNGSTYAANALSFAGPVTLTQSQTTFNTTISPSAAGNITFTGSIYGTTDGAQSVAFIAGPGTGAAGANGDIGLQNAGTDALWLGSVSATGDDFSGATVYVGGNYNSTLTGNQTFTTETLHTRGSVTSNVGGDATGPIASNGNVNVVTGGNFNGNVTAPTGTIQGKTITGTFTGNAFTFIASQNVDVDVNANTINVTAPAGTVDGTFTTISTNGGSFVVNGQTRTGDNGANLNQIVVEGYTLPAGAIVTPSGEIVLPSGMVIGLISPQAGLGAEGGKAKVIIVHSVQRLGELLAQGYVAIIVDLSKNSDETEEVALAN